MKKLLSSIDLSHALIVGGEKKMKDIVALKKGKTYKWNQYLYNKIKSKVNFGCTCTFIKKIT